MGCTSSSSARAYLDEREARLRAEYAAEQLERRFGWLQRMQRGETVQMQLPNGTLVLATRKRVASSPD